MTRDNNDTRKKANAVFFSVIMVISMVAIGFAGFAGSAAADATDIELDEPSVQSGTDVSGQVTDDEDSTEVWIVIDEDGDGTFSEGESNISVAGTNGQQAFSGLSTDGLSEGDYTVYAYQNDSLNDGDDLAADAGASTTLTVDDTAPNVRKTTHYVDSDEGAIIEVAFTEEMMDDFTDAEANISFTDGSDEVTIDTEADFTLTDDGRLAIDTSAEVYNRIDTVELSGVYDAAGNEFDGEVDVTFAATTVDTTTASEDDRAFVGGQVVLEGDVGDSFEIEGSGIDVTRGTGANSQVYVFDTSGLDAGDYNITNDDTTSTLELRNLGLDVSADSDEFQDSEDVTATVTADHIDREVDAVLLDDDGDVAAEETGTIDSDGSLNVNFGEQETGTYSVEVTDVDTGVTATSDDITVVETPEGDVSFEEQIIDENQGDIAEITIQFDGDANDASLRVGDEDTVGYQLDVNVESGGEDNVTVYFNTYTAGDEGDVVWVDDDSDATVTVEEESDISGILDQGDYEMELIEGVDNFDELDDDNAEDVGTLIIEDRSTDSLGLWTAPDDTELDDLDAIAEAVEENTLSQTETIAGDDTLVVEVGATGLSGLLASHDSDNATAAVHSALQTADDEDFELRIRQTSASTGPNQDRKVVDVDESLNAISAVYDDEGTLYLVMDTSNLELEDDEDFADGDVYDVRWQLVDDHLLDPDEDEEDYQQSVESQFDYEDVEVEFDADPVEVEAESDQAISGTTNVAPGHEFNLRVRSASGVQPGFIMTQSVTVDADRTFSAAFDFSEASVDDEFTVRTQGSPLSDQISVDGIVVDAEEDDTPTPTPTPDEDDETPTPTPTPDEDDDETPTPTPDEDDDTPTPDEDDDDEPTEDDTPGFGAVVALIALIAAALLATRRRP